MLAGEPRLRPWLFLLAGVILANGLRGGNGP